MLDSEGDGHANENRRVAFAAPARRVEPGASLAGAARPDGVPASRFLLSSRERAGYFRSANETGSASGLNIPVALSIGGTIVENLVIAGEIWGGLVLAPNGPIESPSILTTALGVNLTYYFMPANIYLSATPSIVVVGNLRTGCKEASFESPGCKGNGDEYYLSIGKFGMRTAVGKEWWIGSHWAVGLALEFSFTLAGDVNFGTLGMPTKASAFIGAVAVGLTYN